MDNNGMPEGAKMVFKGKIFEVWQWEQKMFDGTTQTFERIRRPDSADVIAVAGDKILIELQEQPHRAPFTCVPGGRCDEGEAALDAAKRELLEETGYTAKEWIPFRTRQPFNSLQWSIYTFIARGCEHTQDPHLDAGERITVKLVSFDEFISLSQEPDFRDQELGNYLSRSLFDPGFKETLQRAIWG
jgi:ADP-ribose pyrophosphatase